MISNLPRGLSKRVVDAVTNPLRRAMSGVPDDTSVVPAALEAAGSPEVPEVPGVAGEDPPGDVGSAAEDGTARERSRTPRVSRADRERLKSELRDEMVRDFIQKLPVVTPDEEVDTKKLLQSNLSIGIASVQFVSRIEQTSESLQQIGDNLRIMGQALTNSHTTLARCRRKSRSPSTPCRRELTITRLKSEP